MGWPSFTERTSSGAFGIWDTPQSAPVDKGPCLQSGEANAECGGATIEGPDALGLGEGKAPRCRDSRRPADASRSPALPSGVGQRASSAMVGAAGVIGVGDMRKV